MEKKEQSNNPSLRSLEKTTHIAVVPSAGFSHLVPILEFSKRLVQLHPDLHVACFIPTLGSPPSSSKAILETLPSNITSTFLPPVNPNDLPPAADIGIKIQLTVTLSLPSIHQALKSLSSRTRLVALVTDTFAYEALDFAKEFNILSYVYYPASAMTLSLYFYLPKLDEETSCEYRDLPDPVQIPGCVPIHGSDLHHQTQDRSSAAYKSFLKRVKRFRFLDGIFINSFREMESGAIKALTEAGRGNPPVYPVGPIIQTGTLSVANGLECLRWLDSQQPGSVLYVNFGSGGTLSVEQTTELALGLELSKQNFLWVVRAPSSSVSASYLGVQNGDPLEFLPSGFLERTKNQGLVIPSWAPQIQILSHSSTGGFLCHCGWNSILESVVQGVPILAWPLFAEQKMNAVMLSEGLKVAVRPKVNENGMVERRQIAGLIKSLMEEEEGREMRKRMDELKDAATNALKADGSSTKTLSQFIFK